MQPSDEKALTDLIVQLPAEHRGALVDKAYAACEYGIVLRAKKTARLSARTGLRPGDPKMCEHIGRLEMRNFQKLLRVLMKSI